MSTFDEMELAFQEFNNALQDGNFQKASAAMNSIWIQFQIFAAANTSPDLEELTYLKAPVHFDRGGEYILSLMHVSGPKIRLKGDSGSGIVGGQEETK